jgi:hypothetical protein
MPLSHQKNAAANHFMDPDFCFPCKAIATKLSFRLSPMSEILTFANKAHTAA